MSSMAVTVTFLSSSDSELFNKRTRSDLQQLPAGFAVEPLQHSTFGMHQGQLGGAG